MLFVFLIGFILWLALFIYNYLDGRNLIKDLIGEFRLSRLTLSECDSICSENTTKSDIVVCLTSIPTRLPHIELTLKSLLTQSRRPKKICLHIPNYSNREKTEYLIPSFLTTLQNLEIVRCDDFGPATKLLPALNRFSADQDLLIVDDDMIYPSGLIDHFDKSRKNNPTMAIGSSGWIVPDDLICHFITLRKNIFNIPPMPWKATRVKKPKLIDILQGYSGYLVKPSFFDYHHITDYSGTPEGSYFVDDVWISALCNVPKVILPFKRFCYHSKKLRHIHAASSLAIFNRGNNDASLRNNTIMIQYFKEKWLNSNRKTMVER